MPNLSTILHTQILSVLLSMHTICNLNGCARICNASEIFSSESLVLHFAMNFYWSINQDVLIYKIYKRKIKMFLCDFWIRIYPLGLSLALLMRLAHARSYFVWVWEWSHNRHSTFHFYPKRSFRKNCIVIYSFLVEMHEKVIFLISFIYTKLCYRFWRQQYIIILIFSVLLLLLDVLGVNIVF